jgi:GNAT superfamily N-acetyltransferase
VSDDGLVIRRVGPTDRGAVIRLLAASLGREDDPRYETLYAWKHEENAFGASPAWVACDGDTIAGFRALMRWEFTRGAETVQAVRAVDTATHPGYQGRGIFTRLTLHGLDELRATGVATPRGPEPVGFVFNTPNEQSRPGYLKMGWEVVGRPPTSFRPRGVGAAVRMLGSRTPAERWSSPSTVGAPAAEVLADTTAVDALLASRPRPATLRTHHTARSLQWRFSTPLLAYRAVVGRGGIADGVAILRVRARGDAREAALCEVLAPEDAPSARRALVRALHRDLDADYVLRLGTARDGLFPLPGQGPILTWRSVTETVAPPLEDWSLTLGDIELF